MRISLQIIIVIISFAYIVAAIGYVLLVQLNKVDTLMKEMEKLINNNPKII